MIHNNVMFLAAQERANDLQSSTLQNKIFKRYLDKERQPKRLKHWANR